MSESRQQAYQRRHREQGLCILCANKADGHYCEEHKQKRHAWYMKRTKGGKRNRCSACGRLGHNRTTCKERTGA